MEDLIGTIMAQKCKDFLVDFLRQCKDAGIEFWKTGYEGGKSDKPIALKHIDVNLVIKSVREG